VAKKVFYSITIVHIHYNEQPEPMNKLSHRTALYIRTQSIMYNQTGHKMYSKEHCIVNTRGHFKTTRYLARGNFSYVSETSRSLVSNIITRNV